MAFLENTDSHINSYPTVNFHIECCNWLIEMESIVGVTSGHDLGDWIHGPFLQEGYYGGVNESQQRVVFHVTSPVIVAKCLLEIAGFEVVVGHFDIVPLSGKTSPVVGSMESDTDTTETAALPVAAGTYVEPAIAKVCHATCIAPYITDAFDGSNRLGFVTGLWYGQKNVCAITSEHVLSLLKPDENWVYVRYPKFLRSQSMRTASGDGLDYSRIRDCISELERVSLADCIRSALSNHGHYDACAFRMFPVKEAAMMSHMPLCYLKDPPSMLVPNSKQLRWIKIFLMKKSLESECQNDILMQRHQSVNEPCGENGGGGLLKLRPVKVCLEMWVYGDRERHVRDGVACKFSDFMGASVTQTCSTVGFTQGGDSGVRRLI